MNEVIQSKSTGNQNTSKIIETINKLKPENPKFIGNTDLNSSIIKTMSEYLNDAMDNKLKQRNIETEDNYFIEVNDINSIALNSAPVDSNIKMRSPFVSKTERYPAIKQSPGPGSYNLINEPENAVSKTKESSKAFGSSFKSRTHFL